MTPGFGEFTGMYPYLIFLYCGTIVLTTSGTQIALTQWDQTLTFHENHWRKRAHVPGSATVFVSRSIGRLRGEFGKLRERARLFHVPCRRAIWDVEQTRDSQRLKPRLHYTRRDVTRRDATRSHDWVPMKSTGPFTLCATRRDATRWHATASPELAPVPK